MKRSNRRRRGKVGAHPIIVRNLLPLGAKSNRPFEPTQFHREQVELMVCAGIPLERIAMVIENPLTGHHIDVQTLGKHFRREIDTAKTRMVANVAGWVYKRIMRGGNDAAQLAKFVLQCQGGWTFTQRIEAAITAGVLIAPSHAPTAEQWIEDVRVAMARDAADASHGERGDGDGDGDASSD